MILNIILGLLFIFSVFMACFHEIEEACKEIDEVMQQEINKVNRHE